MLTIISGGTDSGKSKIFKELIRQDVSEGNRVIAIIPDQYSFEFDKELYGFLGAKDFNLIETTGFKRLSEAILQNGNEPCLPTIDENARIILMFKAIKALAKEKQLKYFKRLSEKPFFIKTAVRQISEFNSSGITPNMLSEASEKLSGTIKEKVSELASLFLLYNTELEKNGLCEEATAVNAASESAEKSGWFKGSSVYLDEFDGFSSDEYKMLSIIMKQAKKVTVSLTAADTPNAAGIMSPFEIPKQTEKRLTGLASLYNRPIKFENVTDIRTGTISELSGRLFMIRPSKVKNDGSVKIISADSMYEELEYAAATIRRLTAQAKMRYSDFAVIAGGETSYGGIADGVFDRYGIPLFTDSRINSSQSALVMYIKSVLEAAMTRQYSTETIMRFVRSPLSDIQEFESSAIDDYCVKWNVDGDMWLKDFEAEPAKMSLDRMNEIRKRIIDPLERFKSEAGSATGAEISVGLKKLFDEIKLSEKTYSVIESSLKSEDETSIEAGRRFKQIWKTVIEAIKSINAYAGEDKMTLRQYAGLLDLILSESTVASPPQTLDAVTLAFAGRSRVPSKKAVFVIGLNDGIFPSEMFDGGLFSERERHALQTAGAELSNSFEYKLSSERTAVYKAFASAERYLYCTYAQTDLKGNLMRESQVIRQALSITGVKEAEKASSFGLSYYAVTPRSAYYKLAEHYKDGGKDAEAIKSVLMEIPEYAEKIKRLDNSFQSSNRSIRPQTGERLFAQHDLSLSASRLESYNRCPYSYFLKYGLKISEIRPLEIDPANRGTIVHYVLSNILKELEIWKAEYKKGDGNNLKYQLINRIAELLNKYSEEELCGNFGKSAKFKDDFNRLKGLLENVAENIIEEFSHSKFVPDAYEYSLSAENGKSLLSVKIDDERCINVRGSIDRADIYTSPGGEKYIRIIDYKTGIKKFSYAELLYGLNLQMILYLLALTEGAGSPYKGFKPAGILYMPAGWLDNNIERRAAFGSEEILREKIHDSKRKQYKRSGVILDDEISLEAMDDTFSGYYAPAARKKSGELAAGSEVIPEDAFKKLEQFAADKITEMGKCLLGGKIDAVPAGYAKKIPCRYCEYRSVCPDPEPDKTKLISAEDKEKMRKLIGLKEEKDDA